MGLILFFLDVCKKLVFFLETSQSVAWEKDYDCKTKLAYSIHAGLLSLLTHLTLRKM